MDIAHRINGTNTVLACLVFRSESRVIRIMAGPEGSNWLLWVVVSFAWWLSLCLILGMIVGRSSIILILQANKDVKDDARKVDLNWPVALMRRVPVLVAASAIFDAADRLGKPAGHLATLNFNLICAGPVFIGVAVRSFVREVKNSIKRRTYNSGGGGKDLVETALGGVRVGHRSCGYQRRLDICATPAT